MATFNLWDAVKGNIPVVFPMSLSSGQQSVGGQVQVFSAGQNPAALGVDNILAVYSIPASSFVQNGNGLYVSVYGSFANNGNTKRVKLFYNPTVPVVGQTISGGTLIGDTGSYSTSALSAFVIDSTVLKYG